MVSVTYGHPPTMQTSRGEFVKKGPQRVPKKVNGTRTFMTAGACAVNDDVTCACASRVRGRWGRTCAWLTLKQKSEFECFLNAAGLATSYPYPTERTPPHPPPPHPRPTRPSHPGTAGSRGEGEGTPLLEGWYPLPNYHPCFLALSAPQIFVQPLFLRVIDHRPPTSSIQNYLQK